jgi:hypothetical protein
MKWLLAFSFLLLATPTHAEEIGECRFDRDTLTFAGTPLEQATCLLRKIELLAVRKPQKLTAAAPRLHRSRRRSMLFPNPIALTPSNTPVIRFRKPRRGCRCNIS